MSVQYLARRSVVGRLAGGSRAARDRRAGVPGGGFRRDPVQSDGGRGEPAAVVAQQDWAAQASGDRGGVASQLAHAVAVAARAAV